MSQFKLITNKSLKPYIKSLAELDQQNSLDLMLQLLEFYIKKGFCSEEKIDKAITLAPDSQEYFHEALTGLIVLCQLYLRSPKGFVKTHDLTEVVTELKIKPEFTNEIVEKLVELKEQEIPTTIERPIRLTSPKKIVWRINISNQSQQINIARRTIVMQLTLKNEKVETLVIPLAVFHKLRYQVASLLKGIQDLEGRASMKI